MNLIQQLKRLLSSLVMGTKKRNNSELNRRQVLLIRLEGRLILWQKDWQFPKSWPRVIPFTLNPFCYLNITIVISVWALGLVYKLCHTYTRTVYCTTYQPMPHAFQCSIACGSTLLNFSLQTKLRPCAVPCWHMQYYTLHPKKHRLA